MRLRIALGVMALLAVVGCGSNGTTEAAETTTLSAPAFNPCDQLGDEALQAANLDPESKSTSMNTPAGEPSAWKICRWQPTDGSDYFVGVGTSTFGQEDLADNPTVEGFEDVQIGARQGMTYYQSGSTDRLRCYVSFDAEGGGMHNVILSWRTSKKESIPESPPCTLAIERAQQLEPHLP